MPPKYYSDNDYFFYKWWKEIYQNETDLDTFSVPSRLANATDSDFKRWELLRVYFRGLVDGNL